MRRNGIGRGLKMSIPSGGEAQSGDIIPANMETEVAVVTRLRGLVKFVA